KNNKAQVVQLYGTLAKLRCNVCTNIYDFTLQYCDIFKQGKVLKCTNVKREEKEEKRPHTIGQLKPTVILY
ncbi:35580_t:CDS:2, partial [Racocetra persica]